MCIRDSNYFISDQLTPLAFLRTTHDSSRASKTQHFWSSGPDFAFMVHKWPHFLVHSDSIFGPHGQDFAFYGPQATAFLGPQRPHFLLLTGRILHFWSTATAFLSTATTLMFHLMGPNGVWFKPQHSQLWIADSCVPLLFSKITSQSTLQVSA